MSSLTKGVDKYNAVKDNLFGGAVVDFAKGAGGDFVQTGFDALDLFIRDDSDSDNPFFRGNGYDDPSPETIWYFRSKLALGVTTATLSLTGVGPVIKGAQAFENKTTWYRLAALAESLIPPSRRGKPKVMEGWYGFRTEKHKAVPEGSLETMIYHIIKMKRLATGTTGTTSTLGGLGWVFANLGSWLVEATCNLASGRIAAWFEPASQALAKSLQWRAYREQVLNNKLGGAFALKSGGKGGANTMTNPASRIVEAIWDCSASLTGGGTPWKFVAEPKGWMVLADIINRV